MRSDPPDGTRLGRNYKVKKRGESARTLFRLSSARDERGVF